MQFVTLDHLEELSQSHAINEDEPVASGLTFQKICCEYEKAYRKAQSEDYDRSRSLAVHAFSKDFMAKHCPPLKLIGQGSSRICYAFMGGKCVKIAKSSAGIAQNKNEWNNTANEYADDGLFAQSYDKNDDYSILLTECCSHIDGRIKFLKMMGFNSIDAMSAFLQLASDHDFIRSGCNFAKLMLDVQDYLSGSDPDELQRKIGDEVIDYIAKLSKKSSSKLNAGPTAMKKVVDFWKRNGIQSLEFRDLLSFENWGLAIRDGSICPVIIDAGLSDEIFSKYY